jgi:hypothetical protein
MSDERTSKEIVAILDRLTEILQREGVIGMDAR